MNSAEVVKLMTATSALFPSYTMPSDASMLRMHAETWHSILCDVPLHHALDALAAIAADGRQFAPPPGEIRRRAVERASERSGITAPSADEAMTELYAQIAHVGYVGTPEWSHAALAETVQAIGWQNVCMSENPEALRAHFLRIYDICVKRHEQRMLAPIDPGMKALVDNLFMSVDDAIAVKELNP